MMNAETKRHIDAARDVLIGAVPNPSTQIEQITTALIYKFMDDMDQEAIKVGGKPSFFVDDLQRYSWTFLMDSRIGNQERMKLYSEALEKFSQAKQLPELFRMIFKTAYLPYRSAETLGLFLKEISYFNYSHSEELGNAYEYLLSIMASQGDAGQFRTPRHIIDFIVKVINPTKDDKILDPACGTAGFLISSYKHILSQQAALSPSEQKKLMNNYVGYDIDPTMVRIAQVNMYLHQFKNPQIFNYDTLTQDDRWDEKFDVILANPPFMSPKGGIKPHSRFGLHSNRSEVLFVDYIMNHLKAKGRAGIIVPEGIIFQSGNAYKQLRKNLVENGLYAVISLPSGVFQPYSGVKTSILLIDNELAQKSNEVLFVKVDNDGFDLGAQRRQIEQNDLPQAFEILKKWKNGDSVEGTLAICVEKSKIAEKGDYNLAGERYKVTSDYTNSKWDMIELGKISAISAGNSAPQSKKSFENGKYPFFRTSDVAAVHLSDNLGHVNDWLNEDGIKGMRLFKKGTILFPKSGASTFLNHRAIMGCDGYVSSHLAAIYPNTNLANGKFIFYLLTKVDAKELTTNLNYPSLRTNEIAQIKIPLPPLEIQEQIVAELDGYAAILSGARQIVENWKPKIEIDPSWPMVKLGDVCIDLFSGGDIPKNNYSLEKNEKYQVPIYTNGINEKGLYGFTNITKVNKESITISARGTIGYSEVRNPPFYPAVRLIVAIPNLSKIDKHFLKYTLDGIDIYRNGNSIPQLTIPMISNEKIHLPPLDTQKLIVERIEAERLIVESVKELIKIYEQKTKETIAKLWS